MSYELLQVMGIERIGGIGTPVNIAAPAFDGTNNVHFAAAMTGAAVGDVLTIEGSPSNDGHYTVVQVVSTTHFRVEPSPPVVEVAAGGAMRQDRTDSPEKQTPTAATTFGAANTITAAGALFQTNSVAKNDRVIVSGSTSNDRTWYVQQVLSETQVIVRPLNGLAGLTVEAAAGTVQVRQGGHIIRVIDEATTSWTAIATAAALGTSPFGSGVAADFITKVPIWQSISPGYDLFLVENGLSIGNNYSFILNDSVGGIAIIQNNVAGVTTWDSYREVVVATGNGGLSTRVGDTPPTLWVTVQDKSVGSAAGVTVINIGERGGDRYSAKNTSAWIGVNAGITPGAGSLDDVVTKMKANMSGSLVICPLPLELSGGGDLVASVLSPAVTMRINAVNVGILESTNIVGDETGFVALGPVGDFGNLLIAGSSAIGAVLFANVDVIVGGLLKGIDTNNPLWRVGGGTTDMTALNPREDYTPDELFLALGSSTCKIHYTYNPRFVVDDAVTGIPIPLVGLSVEILSVNETTSVETSVFSGVTDAGGHLSAGAGVVLERATRVRTLGNTFFSHRIIAEGTNLVAVNAVIQMRAEIDTDFPMLPQQTDFEGEFSA